LTDNNNEKVILNYLPTLLAIITLLVTIMIFVWEGERKRHFEILEQRKEAIFDALLVIDHVYDNTLINDESYTPIEWDIQRARTAVNKLLIYSENPKKTVSAFYDALGVHNPQFEDAPVYDASFINEFRKQAARELEISEDRFFMIKKLGYLQCLEEKI